MKTTDTHVYFYSGREIYSNWHQTAGQITDPNTGLKFDSSEQAFMWYKARFFNDIESCEKIAGTTDPSAVKMCGKLVKNYDDDAWECVRYGFMTYVNALKFSQNPEFKRQLLETGNRTLVEASRKDCIWGVGWYETEPQILDEKQWVGRNLLGKALMDVRKILSRAPRKTVEYAYPSVSEVLNKITNE